MTTVPGARPRATVEDLYRVEGKAELVNGEIVEQMAAGRMPGYAADESMVSLRQFVRVRKLPGIAVGDNKAFLVSLPHRESFSPDAVYYEGPNSGMRFFDGVPRFAVEVRSENDYGPTAEREMEQKRAEYFQAGTRVVWDVDLQSEVIVRKYLAPDAEHPAAMYRRGDIAEAEPTVPGWRMAVDDLFE
jgi:Uma2 family endonuclease